MAKDINTLVKENTSGVDYNTGLYDWAGTNGGTGNSLNDRLFTLLGSLGFTGSLQDRMHAFLVDQGYTGSTTDMWYDFWLDGGTIGGVVWTPASLFASGEAGAWYAPDLYASTYGVINLASTNGSYLPPASIASAVEAGTAVAFDLSQDLAESETLLFSSTDVTSWTNNGYETFVDNGSSVTVLKTVAGGTDTAYSNTMATFDLTAGQVWRITYTVTDYSGTGTGYITASSLTNARTSRGRDINANGTYTDYIYVDTSQNNASIAIRTTDTDFGCTVGNISAALVLGNHAYQTTTAARPILRARHNRIGYSEEFDNALWLKTNSTVTTNTTTAPDGTTTADKLAETVDTGSHAFTYSNIAAGPRAYSVYVKAAERGYCAVFLTTTNVGVQVNLSTGAIAAANGFSAPDSYSIEDVGSGWWRVKLSHVSAGIHGFAVYALTDGDFANRSYAGTAGNGIYVWGAQYEFGSVVGPYQRIAAATNYVTSSTMDTYDFPYYLDFDGVDDVFTAPTVTLTNAFIIAWAGEITQGSASGAAVFGWQNSSTARIVTTIRNDGTGAGNRVFQALMRIGGGTQIQCAMNDAYAFHTPTGFIAYGSSVADTMDAYTSNGVSGTQADTTEYDASNPTYSILFGNTNVPMMFYGGVMVNREYAGTELTDIEGWLSGLNSEIVFP